MAELQSAAALSADDQLELALALDERGRAEDAATHYAAAAQGNIGAAELRLGAMTEVGRGVSQSYEEARSHYERAVALGVAEANLRLGMLYLEGWGVKADPAAAEQHIARAAEAGYVPAQKILSDMFFTGVAVKKDLNQALAWAEKAGAKRDPEAFTRIGLVRQAAVKLPQDLQLAREWYQLAAEQDYTRGMLAMAATFLRPNADKASIEIGLRWLDLAAEGGSRSAAFYRAGAWLRAGPATSAADSAKARALLEQAAIAGEPSALEVLQLETADRPLAAAFAYVMRVPFEERYVQRLARTAPPLTAGTRVPQPIKIVSPLYPPALRLQGMEGNVLVTFVVDPTGRVRDAHAIKCTHPGFAEAAEIAVAQWRFAPGVKKGRVVFAQLAVPVEFKLTDVAKTGRGSRSNAREQAVADEQ
ncbi:TonB family protein [Horticoccus luteus]|uniref:TonB family protein n=1 Tax=Horticoccus luteus TaxID=2862869 RepID=A0A8F9XLK2_9BACT|nr:TonB family protein [Horticoccus luteus]QYM79119.1 TonB family protein [Horticoccus luteus]